MPLAAVAVGYSGRAGTVKAVSDLPSPPPAPAGIPAERLRLLLVTDPAIVPGGTQALEDRVAEGLRAGVTAVQLRDKRSATGTLLPLARRLRRLCHTHGALFFINDRLDLALVAGADGVHAGDEDLPLPVIRSLAPSLWVGASAGTAEAAVAAVHSGAHYIGCGAVWGTPTKADAGLPIGVEGLRAVVRASRAPVVAIGGISPERVEALRGSGVAGIAAVSALLGARDMEATVRLYRGVVG
jgi:thiamine-phosphate pyrophosphorylase